MNKQCLAMAVSSLCLAGSAASESTKPNILLILADDLGYADLSVQGCKQFATPNIDSIASNGVRFTEGYVCNSVCAPSRAGLLSGRIGVGFEANLPHGTDHGVDVGLRTMADVLKEGGYKTACIGKWHLGETEKYYPTNRGFDYFCGLRLGSRSYWYDPKGSDKPDSGHAIEENGKQIRFDGYVTDFFTDKAIQRIEDHVDTTPDQPFFMYLSYTAPHGPMHGKPELVTKFAHIQDEKRRIYAAMVTSLDQGVGRVLDVLKEKNVYENTVVVFLSDNGGPTQHNGSNNRPLKGGKGSLWEGGVRVPFMLQWPAKIEAGQIIQEPVTSLDLFPTFESVAQINGSIKPDGKGLIPLLTGQDAEYATREFYWRRGNMKQCGFRSGNYKWIENRHRNQEYLYDLQKDPAEKNNLIADKIQIAAQMKRAFEEWELQVLPPSFSSGWKPKNVR